MCALNIHKYFILFNILATLSQHLPLQRDKRIATIIVSATAAMQTKIITKIATNIVNTRTLAAITAPRTTSASAFVDEVLPHNDSVASTRLLHAKAIDNSISNKTMIYSYNNYSNNINSNTDDFQQLLNNKLQEEQKVGGVSPALTMVDGVTGLPAPPDHRLLSRKRRYLIFPEGSSFQLVYDAIFGVVDYTNYLILGITVALAWELPDKPQGEVLEEIANRLKDDPDNPDLRPNDTVTAANGYADIRMDKAPITIKHLQPTIMKSSRPNYINLLTATSPAARKSATNSMSTQRLSAAFHAPMHRKYYFYNGSNKYDYNSKNHNLLRRPTETYYHRKVALPVGGYYKTHPSDWRRKDNYYYKFESNSKTRNKNFTTNTLKVNPFSKWTSQRRFNSSPARTHSYVGEENGYYSQYPWWNLKSRLSNSLRRKPIPSRRIYNAKISQSQQQRLQQQRNERQGKSAWQQHENEEEAEGAASGFNRQPPATARTHRIYPVFGKRSIADEHPKKSTTATVATTQYTIHNNNNNNKNSSASNAHQQSMPTCRYRRSGIVGPELSRMERIHVRHHRSTRQALYEKIEKYLNKLDIKHSHQCILRALCETGQKSNERRPGTFVGEIMRAVFTIPEALEADILQNRIHYKDQRYDRANTFEGNCAKEYSLCQQSLWDTHFVK
ncbi:uncharacterized protein [Eurosta solidaginis]|uniref:uncharacterized protein n=1 Tax=Eurosta solidaginis TaxID=178769 RepID=UPI00353119C2